jgi:hypothetical protein
MGAERLIRRHDESNLQMSCVRWFRLQYPEMAGLLFAVPNGSKRGRVTAAILKAEGALAGVSDLLFLMPAGTWPYLCIEMKTKTGRQSPAQKEFQNNVEAVGARYALVRSFDEFVSLIREYVKG